VQLTLCKKQTHHIICALANAARVWINSNYSPRITAQHEIAERLGYTEPVVQHALDKFFASITREALSATIIDELGSLDALNHFVPRTNRPAIHARGVDRVAVIASDTTIGVAIPPMIFALCAKAHVTVKDRHDHLVAAFAQTLIEQEPLLAESLHVQAWETHEDPTLHAAIAQADVVVAFGSDETMPTIRAHCKPNARFLPFGHRTSLGYIPREALMHEAKAFQCAREAAPDALLYDGEGCLSTHALFVENGARITPRAFAAFFARACDEAAIRFPYARQTFTPSTAAYRDRAFFRNAQGLGELHIGAASPHLIVFEPPIDEPPPFLPRTIGIYPVESPAEMLRYVHAHAIPLEAIATIHAARDDLIEAFIATGATRITTLGKLQDPPLTGNHGGQGCITPFVEFMYRDDKHDESRREYHDVGRGEGNGKH
jgi:Acyl-CoA reductase (LuxC)